MRGFFRAGGLLPGLLASLALGAGSVADAEETSTGSTSAELARWRGAYCTSAGCSRPTSSRWGMALGFGAAILTAAWCARRGSGGRTL